MQLLNREGWLNLITEQHIKPHFESKGYTIPDNIRMSCSLTSTKKSIGQCWSNKNSGDNHFEIFISPKISDSNRVTDILIHEIVHAVVGLKAGHKKPFADCAKAVGLEGKMTATTATEELKATIAQWVEDMGEYPHAPLTESGIKKQTTRQLKCVCNACGYQVYTSKKWIEIALPICPDSDCERFERPMTEEVKDED
jgi:hypothetical protein